ncbi:GTP-binding protein Rho1 [Serendipita sp. 397]|nr:GTP-binding protein Rho1 [Serendipita sp. 397]
MPPKRQQPTIKSPKERRKQNDRPKEVVIAVPCSSGKRRLLIRYFMNEYPDEYTLLMIDKPQINIPVFSKLVTLDIWRYSYADRLRPVVYLGTSVVIICFGIDDPDSLSSVQDLWVSEVRHLTGNAKPPILLVGCKMDIRTDPVELRRMRWNGGMEPVSMQQVRVPCLLSLSV